MTLKNAIGPVLLGLALATTLSACGSGRDTESPADYARARVPQFIEFLSSNKADVRCEAAFGLGNIARYSEAAIPALTCSLSDPAPEVRTMAEWALCQICLKRGELLATAVTPAYRSRKAGNP